MPFVVTLAVTLLLSTYMLFDPALWLQRFMQLTDISSGFSVFLFGLALVGFGCSWVGEKYVLPRLAKLIGRVKQWRQPKHQRMRRRKRYKLLQEEMRV